MDFHALIVEWRKRVKKKIYKNIIITIIIKNDNNEVRWYQDTKREIQKNLKFIAIFMKLVCLLKTIKMPHNLKPSKIAEEITEKIEKLSIF